MLLWRARNRFHPQSRTKLHNRAANRGSQELPPSIAEVVVGAIVATIIAGRVSAEDDILLNSVDIRPEARE